MTSLPQKISDLLGTEPLETEAEISVVACEVGMAGRDITADQLRPGVGTVDSAAAALADAQLVGAAYLRI